MDQKSFLASPSYHDESWRGVEQDPSDSLWRFPCSSPRSGRSRNKVDVLRTWSPRESFTVPSTIGNTNVSPFWSVDTSFALSLQAWISDASIFSNSSMSATTSSPFQVPPAFYSCPRNIPRKTHGPNWCSRDRSSAEIGWYSTIAPNGTTGPLNGAPNRLSWSDFPSDNWSCMFRR